MGFGVGVAEGLVVLVVSSLVTVTATVVEPSFAFRVCCPEEEVGTVTAVVKVPFWSAVAVPKTRLSHSRVIVPGVNHLPATVKVSPFCNFTALDKSVLLPNMPLAVWVLICVSPRWYCV